MFGEEIYYTRSFNATVHSIVTVCTIVMHFCTQNGLIFKLKIKEEENANLLRVTLRNILIRKQKFCRNRKAQFNNIISLREMVF